MDPFSALTVAASVVQFIQFGSSLISTSIEIYQSAEGASTRQIDIELTTLSLVGVTEKIKAGADDQALQTICSGCISVSSIMVSKLAKLKMKQGSGFRKCRSIQQAVKIVWSIPALEDLAARLKAYREEMCSHVLVSLRYDSDTLSQIFKELLLILDMITVRNSTLSPFCKMKDLLL
jgi:hypothetical protein